MDVAGVVVFAVFVFFLYRAAKRDGVTERIFWGFVCGFFSLWAWTVALWARGVGLLLGGGVEGSGVFLHFWRGPWFVASWAFCCGFFMRVSGILIK
ncbi:hypothetical protein [Bartonella acomydis]|uniref:hypothetical protein n=1 Tax=Bartonella acomydis TaxID=686234 RepID=UPI0031EC9FE8